MTRRKESHVLLQHIYYACFPRGNILENKSRFRVVQIRSFCGILGTMGFLFMVQHDWPREGFMEQIGMTVTGSRQINALQSPRWIRDFKVGRDKGSFLRSCCVYCNYKKEPWSAGEFLINTFLKIKPVCNAV